MRSNPKCHGISTATNSEADMKPIDCILIPGGGLQQDGSLPPWTIARLDRTLTYKDRCRWFAALSGGTVHKPPPRDGRGYPIYESRAAANYLIQAGVEPQRILTEISSYDTIGNAYFSRMLFTEPIELQHLLVITSQFHLARVQAAFNWVYQLTPLPRDYWLDYEGVPNQGLTGPTLKARIQKEKDSLATLHQTRQAITTIKDFTSWLYSEHAAYTPGKGIGELPSDLLSSY